MNNYTFILIGILIAVALGYLMLRYLDPSLRGSKWELISEGKRMKETIFNPLWGMGMIERDVIADVYRKKLRNGTYKYKTVPRH